MADPRTIKAYPPLIPSWGATVGMMAATPGCEVKACCADPVFARHAAGDRFCRLDTEEGLANPDIQRLHGRCGWCGGPKEWELISSRPSSTYSRSWLSLQDKA